MASEMEALRLLKYIHGKENTYVRNELSSVTEKNGEKQKTKITSVEGTVDKELVCHHLNGLFGIGICPVRADGKCFYGVIDIDCYNQQKNLNTLSRIRDLNLPLVAFRSKSGGLHLYVFSALAVTARAMKELLSRVSYYLCLEDMYGKGKIEIFPKQEKLQGNGFGSAVTLPYFNAEGDCPNPMLDMDGNELSYKEAVIVCAKHASSFDAMQEAFEAMPYSDAPPCLQRILISSAVGSDSSGRNNFLFSFAVYAKKKYGFTFPQEVEAVNAGFEVPLDDAEVQGIIHSVSTGEFTYKCSDIPCNAYCSKAICREREYGLGREKGHFTGVEYGQLFRYLTAEPYYVWELRLQGDTAPFRSVIFKDEKAILSQDFFAQMCVRYLNQAPQRITDNDWRAIINTVMPGVKDVKVSDESDTSAAGAVRRAFRKYLANKQARNDSPYQIRVGLCVRREEKDKVKYYFTHEGFEDYLNIQKIDYDANLLREALKGFGAEEDEFIYSSALGDARRIKCWSKEEDAVLKEEYTVSVEVAEEDARVSTASEAGELASFEEAKTTFTEQELSDAEKLF